MRFTFFGKNAVFVGEKKRKGERGEEGRGRKRKEGEGREEGLDLFINKAVECLVISIYQQFYYQMIVK